MWISRRKLVLVYCSYVKIVDIFAFNGKPVRSLSPQWNGIAELVVGRRFVTSWCLAETNDDLALIYQLSPYNPDKLGTNRKPRAVEYENVTDIGVVMLSQRPTQQKVEILLPPTALRVQDDGTVPEINLCVTYGSIRQPGTDATNKRTWSALVPTGRHALVVDTDNNSIKLLRNVRTACDGRENFSGVELVWSFLQPLYK